MSSINYKENIVIPAWDLIKDHRELKKLNITSGFLSVLFLTVILTYQAIYTYVVIFNKKDKALQLILEFFESKYLVEVLVLGGVFLLLYTILIPIFDGALIKHINSIHKNEEQTIGESIGYGTYKFFKVFEYNNLFNTFKFISVVNGFLFLIRFLGVDYIEPLSYIFLVIFILATIINILFSYSKFEIVLNNKKVFPGVGASSKISLLNLGLTVKIYFLMFILNLRVIFNFIIFLAFPIAIASALTYFTTQIYITISIIILSLLFLGFIVFLAHMASVLEIFRTTVWYLAYEHGKKKLANEKEEDD